MLMDLISNDHRDELCDPGEQQVGVKGLLIPGLAPGNTKTVLEMADGLFNSRSDLVGGSPLVRTAERTRVGTQVFLGIDIKHPAAGRSCTRVFTMADTFALTGLFIVYPFHLGTYKLHGREPAAQMGSAPFPLHRERRVFRTAWDTILVQRAV